MSDLRISELPLAQTIQGNEKVVLVQNNETRRSTVQDLLDSNQNTSNLEFEGDTGSGSVEIESQVLSVTGTNGVTTEANGNYINIDTLSLQEDISLNSDNIAINTEAISENTAKVGITPQQISDIGVNNSKVGITPLQTSEIIANTAKAGISPSQSSAILANTEKVGITTSQASNIVTNSNKVGYTEALVSANPNVLLNTSKVGITSEQSQAILDNTAKEGVTNSQSQAIEANTLKVGYTDALVSANTDVVANTAKVSITPAQATAISDNTSNIGLNTGDISTINSTAEFLSNKGQASGYVPLDENGKILETYLPASIVGQLSYIGTWNASTDDPALPDATTVNGNYYIVSTAGTYLSVSYEIGDWIVSNGVAWQKIDNTDDVKTVFGRIGNILATEADYNAFYPTITDLPNLVANNSAVAANTLKTGITAQQDSDITANNAKVGYTDALVSSNYDVSANTAKVGITTQQASDIETNNSKISYTDASAVSTNTQNIATNSQNIGNIASANDSSITLQAGVGLSGGDVFTTNQLSDETISFDVDLDQLSDSGTLLNTDKIVVIKGTSSNKRAIQSVPLSLFNNDEGWTSNSGDITGVEAGTDMTGGGVSGDVVLNVTSSVAADNNSIVKRDSSGNILANKFQNGNTNTNSSIGVILTQVDTASNNYISPSTPAQFRAGVTDAHYTNNLGTITGVTGSGGLTGGGTSGNVTLSVDSTFVRTSGAQSISGVKSFTGDVIVGTDIYTTQDTLKIQAGGNNGTYIEIDDASGEVVVGSDISASNLSGTNTGDQDLSGYLLNTTDTFTGDLTVTGDIFLQGGGENYAAISPISQGMKISVGDPANTNSPLVTFDGANQRVGIGTTDPKSKLHISSSNSTDTPTAGTTNGGLFISNASKTYGLNLGVQNTGKSWIQGQRMDGNTSLYDLLLQPLGGKVGIGTTSPQSLLHISDDTGLGFTMERTGGAPSTYTVENSGARINHNYVGGANGYRWQVEGNMRLELLENGSLYLNGSTALKVGGGSWGFYSDERVKKDISNYTKGLDEILSINPVTYKYNGKANIESEKEFVGIIAQEIKEVLPSTIEVTPAKLNDEDEFDTDLLTFDASELTFTLINAVKELKAEIEELKKQIRQ